MLKVVTTEITVPLKSDTIAGLRDGLSALTSNGIHESSKVVFNYDPKPMTLYSKMIVTTEPDEVSQ